MDKATETALRAILNGLHLSGGLSEDQMASVVRELEDAAAACAAEDYPVEAAELHRLARGITQDALEAH